MRPPRLLLLIFCLLFIPILVTFFSALTSSPRVSTPSSFAGRTTGLHALFSFNIPSSLFPPSAIISLTDENSTFFLARPAAFGPLLPDNGLSGQLWVGSGFGERTTKGAEGELGCSDIPGWGEGDSHKPTESHSGRLGSSTDKDPSRGQDYLQDSDIGKDAATQAPSTSDGTDDHLHHPLPESVVDLRSSEKQGDPYQNRQTAHADIQSLQESAEINGKVVLLSRGGCGFLEKVKWAQRRGGIALIVGDDTRGGSLVTMYARGDTSNVTIPALFTSHTTAHLLSSLVPPQDREESSVDDRFGASRTKLPGHGGSGKESTSTASATPSPSSTHSAVTDKKTGESKAGLLSSLLSVLGLGNSDGRAWHLPEDSRRPPSSGNINWIPMDIWDDQEMSWNDLDRKHLNNPKDRKTSKPTADSIDGDGFVIGVQDWRDPDLVATKSSIASAQTDVTESDSAKIQTNNRESATLKGGSITPGSGEYRTLEKPSVFKESSRQNPGSQNPAGTASEGHSGTGSSWFTRHFGRAQAHGQELGRLAGAKEHNPFNERSTHDLPSRNIGSAKGEDREGLWVTLTPTSMSTSPFFDTLLVLVVSPLLTLTVVYVLLLLRSRIRRRRWRAPKSLVDRLPVRTYHTISTASSSGASSLRSLSPGPVSQTSPLLGTKTAAERTQTPNAGLESKIAGSSRRTTPGTSTLWRRKYTGRQVECVVCLEEYIDGQSRVMSLPCGHEFHAECITPWLTTRRRTCPICKGDVVRSMSQNHYPETRERMTEDDNAHDLESHHSASSAPMPISGMSEDDMSDAERHAASDTGLLEGRSSSTPPSWRNFAALSFSALSGDTIWHQGRTDSDR